jgi:predicted MFS family arabinose efflux permease
MPPTESLSAPEIAPQQSQRGLTMLMAVTCGLTVANLYYCQPLLTEMGTSLGSKLGAAYIPTYAQIGTMFGMGLFVPLGDMFERRRLIVTVCCALSLMLMASAAAPNLFWLSVASLCLGLTCIVPHLILPFAAQIAKPEQRGRVLGAVVSGLLIGILCARTFSGFFGAAFGWRSVYWASAVVMFALAMVLRKKLPESHPSSVFTYGQLLRSLGTLFKQFSALREAAFTGAMFFGAFSALWATLIFRLSTTPFHYGSRVAGLFGLVGAAGAAAAPVVGRMADKRGPRTTVKFSLLITATSFVVFWIFGGSMSGLIAGVILMDLGVQAGHVSNQTRIYALLPEARSRLNTVYMVSYFFGGAIGSAFGAYGWDHARWPGVCAVGLLMIIAGLVAHFFGGRRNTRRDL